MNKTAHQLAYELLALPDLPIYHFDPSRAGMDDERDTSLSHIKVERHDPEPEDFEAALEAGDPPPAPCLMLVGDYELKDEPGAWAEERLQLLEQLTRTGTRFILRHGVFKEMTLEGSVDEPAGAPPEYIVVVDGLEAGRIGRGSTLGEAIDKATELRPQEG